MVQRDFSAAATLLPEVIEGTSGPLQKLDSRLLLVARALAGETFSADAIEAQQLVDGDALFKKWFMNRFQQSISYAARE